jgi:hypothetical protein
MQLGANNGILDGFQDWLFLLVLCFKSFPTALLLDLIIIIIIITIIVLIYTFEV